MNDIKRTLKQLYDLLPYYEGDKFSIIEECTVALEKQIPRKLKYYAETEEDFAHVKCPNCKNVLETAPLFIKNNYCDECGQKLDWAEV